jgi:hypothetical protein
VAEEIDQADTSHKGVQKGEKIQAPATEIDNVNCFDIAESNVLDKIDKSNTSKDRVAEDSYYLDTMHRTVSTAFASQLAVDDGYMNQEHFFSMYLWWRDTAFNNSYSIV